MYYDHDDDSFLREIDFEAYQSNVGWVEDIVNQVVPMEERLEISCWSVDSETAECSVEGGRFAKPIYETNAEDLLDTIKQAYPELDWEV